MIALDGEVTLPTNPNAVVFFADAAAVLGGRSWTQVQQLGVATLEPFCARSGLSGVLGFAWRVNTDRKNRRVPQVLLVCVFDGPATAADLKVLEDQARLSAVGWSTAQIERIPQNCAMSVMVRDGKLLQLWEIGGGEPRVRDLVLGDRGVMLRERVPADCAPADFLPGVRHVRARHPRFEDHDADLERMRLVFAHHFARRIVEADGRVREEEVVFLDTVFPGHLMHRLGIDDAASAEAWLDKARRALPQVLGHHDKLAMIGLFFSACYSDGTLDAREMRVLKEAGEALGLAATDVGRYLERFW